MNNNTNENTNSAIAPSSSPNVKDQAPERGDGCPASACSLPFLDSFKEFFNSYFKSIPIIDVNGGRKIGLKTVKAFLCCSFIFSPSVLHGSSVWRDQQIPVSDICGKNFRVTSSKLVEVVPFFGFGEIQKTVIPSGNQDGNEIFFGYSSFVNSIKSICDSSGYKSSNHASNGGTNSIGDKVAHERKSEGYYIKIFLGQIFGFFGGFAIGLWIFVRYIVPFLDKVTMGKIK